MLARASGYGPVADYLAVDTGYRGNPAAAEMQAAVMDARFRIRSAGKAPGIPSAEQRHAAGMSRSASSSWPSARMWASHAGR